MDGHPHAHALVVPAHRPLLGGIDVKEVLLETVEVAHEVQEEVVGTIALKGVAKNRAHLVPAEVLGERGEGPRLAGLLLLNSLGEVRTHEVLLGEVLAHEFLLAELLEHVLLVRRVGVGLLLVPEALGEVLHALRAHGSRLVVDLIGSVLHLAAGVWQLSSGPARGPGLAIFGPILLCLLAGGGMRCCGFPPQRAGVGGSAREGPAGLRHV
mmetsp:Transcript_53286/g.169282  ORF Transcript_53286/g.169282 Transcript_53286/m.169282 type:complete len:211 (+) Transcript_53286:1934-2566(+)